MQRVEPGEGEVVSFTDQCQQIGLAWRVQSRRCGESRIGRSGRFPSRLICWQRAGCGFRRMLSVPGT